MQLKLLQALLIIALVSSSFAIPHEANAEKTSSDRLESKSLEQKNELLRKKKRFDNLSAEEQQRLRELHEKITTNPDAGRLKQTLVRYNEWLKTLDPIQQAELQGLSMEDRIAKIKELCQRQDERTLRAFAELKLPQEDIRKIFMWMENFISSHEEEILAAMPPRYKTQYKNAQPVQRRALLRGAFIRGIPRREVPIPNQEDVEMLLSRVTPRTREVITIEPEARQKILNWFAEIAVFRKMRPVSDEELRQFYREILSDQQRTELDDLPVEERQMKLRQLYYRYRQERASDRNQQPPTFRDRLNNPNVRVMDKTRSADDRISPNTRP